MDVKTYKMNKNSYEHIAFSSAIIKNRLYFAVTHEESNSAIIPNTEDVYFFTTDDELIYYNYYYDFGPLNLSCLYKYCCKMNAFLQRTSNMQKIVHYASSEPNKRSNAAYLMGSFAVLYLQMEPKEIYKLLLQAGGPYKNFVDASQGASAFTLHLIDCLNAVLKAAAFNFFDFNDFNIHEYDMHSKIQFGDLNWLLPRKFLAFIGPTEQEANYSRPPEVYINYFLRNDVRTVVRLNNKAYNSLVFKQAGISHYELFFPDGTTPPKAILMRFLEISESRPGAIAAGLGRTGSLIGAYIIKHYQMTARETIAWLRICRPGCVIGQQQVWLEKLESWLWKIGSDYRLQHFGSPEKIPRHKYGVYSKVWPLQRKKILADLYANKLSQSEDGYQYLPKYHVTESYYYDPNSETDVSDAQNGTSKKSVGVNAVLDGEAFKQMYASVRNQGDNSSSATKSKKAKLYRTPKTSVDEYASQGDRLNSIKYGQELRKKQSGAKRNNTAQSGNSAQSSPGAHYKTHQDVKYGSNSNIKIKKKNVTK